MSDADGGPSTSRGKRKSGVNMPRTPAKPAAMTKKERDSREDSNVSDASSEPKFANREQKNLFTPHYGGKLFTAPTSNKRERKTNSRFSPPPPEQKLKQKPAAELDDSGAVSSVERKKGPIRNLKDTVGQLKKMKSTLKKQVFSLPPNFGRSAADLYRHLPKDQWGKEVDAATKAPRSKSAGPSSGVVPHPKMSKAAAAALACFNFTEPSGSEPKRGKSIPTGGRKARIKKESMDEEEEEKEEEEEEEDEEEREDTPPRGRRKWKGPAKKDMEDAHESRGRVKFELKVKEEPIDSENDKESVEETTVIQPKKRGRKSKGSAPPVPPPTAPSVVSAGRRKSGAAVVVKQEPLNDEEEDEPIGRRRSMRGETSQGITRIIKTEPEEDAVASEPRAPRKSVTVKEPSPLPSTSAGPAERSLSRKRGRPSMNKNAPVEETEEKDPMVQPPAKRKYTRKSNRSSIGSEETKESEETKDSEEMEVEEKKEKTPGKRSRRTASELFMAQLTEEEKEEAKKTDQVKITRRSSRSHGEETAAVATPVSTKASPKGDNPSGIDSALSRMAGRLNADHEGQPDDPLAEDAFDMGDIGGNDGDSEAMNASIGEGKKTKRQLGGADTKPSTSSVDTSRMLLDDSTAEKSGYGDDSSQEGDTEHEGAVESADEEHASTSLETPAKRGRGRPRKDGLPCKTPLKTPFKTPRKIKEVIEPVVREKRTKAPNPKFAEYINEETMKQTKRASGGSGMAASTRTSGASFDAPSPYARPLTPPPVVKAAPGSALSIMRNIKSKKLPLIRSPSPIPTDRAVNLGKLAAAVATIADAPPIVTAAEKKEKERAKKEDEDKPGPSRKSTSTPSKDKTSEPVKKEDEEGGKEMKAEAKEALGSGSDELARLADYGSSSDSGGSQEQKAPEDRAWITPDCIRGRSSKRKSLPMEQDPVTGKLKVKEEESESIEGDKEKEKEREEQEKKDEEASKVEESVAEAAEKKEETAQDLIAGWNESRKAIDQSRLEAGLPVLPPEPAAISSRASRRSINAPARFGDYDLNYGDVRKKSATVASPAALPVSPVLSEGKKQRWRKKDQSGATPTIRREEEEPSSSKDKHQPRVVLKIKLGSHSRSSSAVPSTVVEGEEEEQEEAAGEEYDDMMDEDSSPAPPSVLPTPSTNRAVIASAKKRIIRTADKRRVKPKAFAKKWKRCPTQNMGFIELDDKKVESVRLVCASAIDSMLSEICNDGILKSTLTMKEQASEQSLLSAAKRRVLGLVLPPLPYGSRPKPAPFVLPPREERAKRIRHAPQSKEYDNLAVSTTAVVDPVAPAASYHTMAGIVERKPQTERRKESRQEAAIKKASLAAIAAEVAPTMEVEASVEKPKKEKKRDREREKSRTVVVKKDMISYDDFIRQKAHNMERLPGKVLSDTTDLFYREIFTDEYGLADDESSEMDVDVDGFTALPDDKKTIGSVAIGVLSEEAATKLLAVLPRPAPYPDEDDDGLEEEEREWMDEDMKRAVSGQSEERRKRVEEVLRVINSQRAANLAVQGTKGEHEVLYTTYQKHAYRLKELLPIYTQLSNADTTWLHRTFIRLIPAHLLPVYLETVRFLKYIVDSKYAAALSKSLLERGVDEEWDDLFQKEQTDDDRTEPMLNGSESAKSGTSLLVDDVTATMESVLKTLEQKEEEETAAPAADPVPAASPDSDQGLVIDEEPTMEEKAAEAAAAAAAPTETVAAAAAEMTSSKMQTDMAIVEEVQVEEIKKTKPELASVCSILSDVTEKRVKEANVEILADSFKLANMDDVIPILVSPTFDIEDAPEGFAIRNKSFDCVYRLIRYATPTPAAFKPIRPRIPSGQISVAEAMDAAVDFVLAAVKAAVKNKGNKRVILFGWGVSCYINHRVVQLAYGVSGIVNFAFPLKSGDGWRGTPDDDICLTYCPTLFVMGEDADDFDPFELLHLRMNMIQSAGALIIGNADSQLNVSSLRLSRERITQKIVARIIVEQVIDFINLPANQLERAKLVPCQINNIYGVEPAAMKAFTGQEAQQAMVTGAGRRPSNYSGTIPIETPGMTAAHTLHRRQSAAAEEKMRRKRSRIDEQTTAAGRMASQMSASAAPITKRSRTDDLPTTSHGTQHRLAMFNLPPSVPSPLASPSLNSPGGYRNRPAILGHSQPHHHAHHYYMQPSPLGGPSTSAAGPSGLLLQTATARPANAAAAAAPSPRGPLDPASISLA